MCLSLFHKIEYTSSTCILIPKRKSIAKERTYPSLANRTLLDLSLLERRRRLAMLGLLRASVLEVCAALLWGLCLDGRKMNALVIIFAVVWDPAVVAGE